jgi:fructuronate reductase
MTLLVPVLEHSYSTYQPASVGIGIVHIGLGAFHRAHQAVYLEHWLNRNGGGDWGICAANIRSNAAIADSLDAQNCRYHVAEYRDRDHVRITEVNSIRRALFAGRDKRELLERMTTPTTKIVSLTVTEKGYFQKAASGELLLDSPEISHDIRHPKEPRTAPGLLLEALRRRRSLSIPPFTILCCDNMSNNGARTKQAVCQLAEANSVEFAAWIDAQVPFPSSMVDRIVPAVSEKAMHQIESLLGFSDPAAVIAEEFSQWVIEDQFPLGRPDWETVGVEMVDDVEPFETMKLRLLNGAHSLLAYVGLLRGKRTVEEAIKDAEIADLVGRYFDEATASLADAPGLDIDTYQSTLLVRFRNDALEHLLSQIAMDGSQKIPQRWLAGALVNLERNHPISATARAVAAWMAYVRGRDVRGRKWPVEDPLADRLAECHRLSSASQIVDSLLEISEIFPESLRTREDFRASILIAYSDMLGSAANG